MKKTVDNVFRAHGVFAKVNKVVKTPAYYNLYIIRRNGVRLKEIRDLLPEVSAALSDELGVETPVRFHPSPAIIEVPRPKPSPVFFNFVDNAPGVAIPGRCYTGYKAPFNATVDLTQPESCHVLIAGMTGSGKTMLLRSLLLSLAYSTPPSDMSFVLVDPQGIDLKPLERLPHVTKWIVRPDEITHTLTEVAAMIDAGKTPRSRVAVVIEELAMLTPDYDRRATATVQGALSTIASRGRAQGVHLIAATQKPLSKIVGSLVKGNIPMRFCGYVATAADARTTLGVAGSGAEHLPGRGAFLYAKGGKHPKRMQAFYINDIEPLVDEVCNRWGNEKSMVVFDEAGKTREKSVPERKIGTALTRIFEQYYDPDTDELRRGGLRAAMNAHYQKPPTGGPPFYRAKVEIEELLEVWKMRKEKTNANTVAGRHQACSQK